MGYGRPLNNNQLIENFLSNCLGVGSNITLINGKTVGLSTITKSVRDAEHAVDGTVLGSTLRSLANRDHDHRTDLQRRELRGRIVEELLTLDRLGNDEDIKLGCGGAKPRGMGVGSKPAKPQAFLITGLPASGKSSIVSKVADHFGAYVVDPDYAKRKLPEFDGTMAGASVVHEESSAITFSAAEYDDPSFLLSCIRYKYSIVRPMIGGHAEKLEKFRALLNREGYEVHLTSITLDRKSAATRALRRFVETGRYVSLSYVFDEWANDPALIYYKDRLDAQITGESPWASLGAISTDKDSPELVDVWGSNNPASLF